jgi:RNA polymerase sigma-70 factor (ECF subfamily)
MSTTDTDPSSALLAGCLAGDEAAIEALVRQYEGDVFRFTLSVLNDPTEAREVAQEAFIAALKSLRGYRAVSFKAWLFTIALNLSRSRLRKRKSLERLRHTLTSLLRLDLQQRQALPEDMVIQHEKERLVWDVLSNMDEKHRLPLILRYYNDLPTAEIAEMLGLPEGTIHSRLHIGRERLRVELKKLAGE